MTLADLALAAAELTPPCEEFRCGCYNACAQGPLACDSFVLWARTGKLRASPDHPTRKKYDEVFNNANL